jgi:hypothetical protein
VAQRRPVLDAQEFKIRPEWDGGNPRPSPEPLHQKGVIAYDGSRKPAFGDIQRLFRSVDQFPGDGAAARGARP